MPVAAKLGGDELADFLDDAVVQCGVADDAAAGDVFAAEFELRLDQTDDGAAVF